MREDAHVCMSECVCVGGGGGVCVRKFVRNSGYAM